MGPNDYQLLMKKTQQNLQVHPVQSFKLSPIISAIDSRARTHGMTDKPNLYFDFGIIKHKKKHQFTEKFIIFIYIF